MVSDAHELILCSADRNDEYLRLNPSKWSFVIEQGDPLRLGIRLSGVFGRMDVGPVALYRMAHIVWLHSSKFLIPLDEDMRVDLVEDKKVRDRRNLLLSAGVFELSLRYSPSKRWRDEYEQLVDFTHTEAEDFDFGLFVANLVNDKNRLRMFYAD